MVKSAKIRSTYSCQNCSNVTMKWAGRCDSCDSWGSIIEDDVKNNGKHSGAGKILDLQPITVEVKSPRRVETNILEFDRVLGGGLVNGSVILLGGEPGIGKSTIMMQLASSASDLSTMYVTGEESIEQSILRAKRILTNYNDNIHLVSSNSVEDIIATAKQNKNISLLIIDSVQMMQTREVDSIPGTVSQIRASADLLISFAKSSGKIVIFIGHVTKEGVIAGPKILEHMVDTVLYFENNRTDNFRILRTIKNRFGPTNEIGIFEMSNKGLQVVTNPSELFLGNNDSDNVSGKAVFAGMEGSRPVIIEIQALVVDTSMPTPRRAVVGWDSNRLAMIVAILNKRYGLYISDKEIYLNVAGGFKITETAADLAVALALISATLDIKLPNDLVICGELSLSGGIHAVSNLTLRMKESARLGFKYSITPESSPVKDISNYSITNIKHMHEILESVLSLCH